MLTPSEARELLIGRLAVIVDEDRPDFIRRAVVKEVQGMLAPGHPLRERTPEQLLNEIKPAWGTGLYLEGGRGIERRVQRPPQSIADVW
jgi:hypothetical protein